MTEKVIIEFETEIMGIDSGQAKKFRLPKEYYTLTNERLKIKKQGLVTQELKDIELFKVKDINVKQSFTDKIRKVGTLEIISADESDPVIKLRSIKHPHEIREKIRDATKQARETAGVSYRYDL